MEGFAEVTEELINEYLSFFGKNHVFSDAERTLLNSNWTQLVVKKNERVVTEGQKTLLWVEKGVLRIGKKDSRHEGMDCVCGFAVPHDFVSMDWFLQAPEMVWNLYAEQDSVLWRLSDGVASVLSDKVVLWDKIMTRWYAHYVKRLWMRNCYLCEANVVKRYRRMMEWEGKRLQAVSLKHLASYLNMTPQTLSRIRKGEDGYKT